MSPLLTLALLAVSLLFLPAAYLLLRRRMRRAVPNPPIWPFFFNFGTLGGYLLLLALGPDFFTFMFAVPFLGAALISLFYSLLRAVIATPRSQFHTASAWMSGCLVLLILWSAGTGLKAFTYAGTWDDDPGNWSRAMGGQPLPPEVIVWHSRYSRSPHFTYEASYFFEFSAPEKSLQDWIAFQKLVPGDPTGNGAPQCYEDPPIWFTPPPRADYDVWLPANAENDSFRLYRSHGSGRMYVTDCQ